MTKKKQKIKPDKIKSFEELKRIYDYRYGIKRDSRAPKPVNTEVKKP